jgi:hypothetical protein
LTVGLVVAHAVGILGLPGRIPASRGREIAAGSQSRGMLAAQTDGRWSGILRRMFFEDPNTSMASRLLAAERLHTGDRPR